MKMFCIRDNVAEVFHRPFFCHNLGEAMRMVMTSVQDEESPYHLHCRDYDLYEVGDWNEFNGVVKRVMSKDIGEMEIPKRVCSLGDFAKDKEESNGANRA